jgi:hypothetical protein
MRSTLEPITLYEAFLVQEEYDGGLSIRRIAKKWDVNHAQISNLVCHLKGVGHQVERKIAEIKTGGSIDELRRRAKEWHAKHPGWRPRAYKPDHTVPRNADFAWWATEAVHVAAAKPAIAWAIAAAAEKPQGDEPRAERRRAYVERAAESILDLPEKTIATLRRRHSR